jgi:L-alanine-DL-glutamate epimerase and related enzymes of enolase superfamily
MILEAEIFPISLRRPFRIAHGTSTVRQTVLVRLREGNFCAHGEGALPPYYPSQPAACLHWLKTLDPSAPLPPAPPEAAAARVAVEMALCDLAAQRAGQPLWKFWRLDPSRTPPCPTTLSIPENENDLHELLGEARAAGAPALKLKSGSGDPEWDRRCADITARSGLPFSIDANAGWTPATAAGLIPRLATHGVAFFEQPVSRDIAAWRELRDRLGPRTVPPLVADESLQTEADLHALAEVADGMNIKILKAGGLEGARRWIALTRSLQKKVMVGVMVETGIGRTAAAHLAPLADWLDIDPPSSIPTAPLCGFEVVSGRIRLSDRPGLGLV